jgi:transcriptional regulator with XRE-family HTH domain
MITDDENMPELSCLPASALKPLDPGLRPEVRVWVDELRAVWQATGLSMGQFAVLHPFDKGTISRYLSGRRVPGERHFLDTLLTTLETYGRPVTADVREYLTGLQMRALEAAHPHEYRVRLVKDELGIALTGRLEAERYAHALEEQLAERNREVHDLAEDRNRLRATLDAEYARLLAEIEKLSRDLALARSRSDRADQRCLELESVLDVIDQAYADQNHEVDDPPAAPYADWGSIASRVLPLDDPYAVADFLSLLDRLGSRDHARQLADRVLEHFSDRRRSSDDRMKQDGLLPLLATMNRLRLYDQAEKFSALLGYTCNRYVRRSAPAVAGRFS